MNENTTKALLKAAYKVWMDGQQPGASYTSPYICDCINHAVAENRTNDAYDYPARRLKRIVTALIDGCCDVQTYLNIPFNHGGALDDPHKHVRDTLDDRRKHARDRARHPDAMAYRAGIWKRLADRFEVEL